MPPGINGYNNAQFNQFVAFAQQQMEAGNNRTIARVGGDGPLVGRRHHRVHPARRLAL
jgi:hypothetical protein